MESTHNTRHYSHMTQYPSQQSQSTTKTTKTTVREFDADERCIKETVTEITETTHQPHWTYNPQYTTSGHAATIKHTA